MKKTHWGITLLLLCGLGQALAFPGEIEVVKEACWKDYDVQIKVIDGRTSNVLYTLDLPKGKERASLKTEISPRQEFYFRATYSPVFWESDKNKTYLGKKYISAPAALSSTEHRWSMFLCFGRDFKSIPLPPKTDGHCPCPAHQLPAGTK